MTTAITQPNDDQEMAEKNPFKILKMQVSSSPTPTINLVDSDLEEELLASIDITKDMDKYLQPFTNFLNGDGKKDFISVPIFLHSTYVYSSSSLALLLSSI